MQSKQDIKGKASESDDIIKRHQSFLKCFRASHSPEYENLISEVEEETGQRFKYKPFLKPVSLEEVDEQLGDNKAVAVMGNTTSCIKYQEDLKRWDAKVAHELRHIIQKHYNPACQFACKAFREGWAQYGQSVQKRKHELTDSMVKDTIDEAHSRGPDDLSFALDKSYVEDPYVFGYLIFRTIGEAYGDSRVNQIGFNSSPNEDELIQLYEGACKKLGYTPITKFPQSSFAELVDKGFLRWFAEGWR